MRQPGKITPPKPTTMAQIAERAGVALSTVSYVLSGKRVVSPLMRERVLAAVEQSAANGSSWTPVPTN